jgi:diguanylate cyclase (GGDEF)-like protein
MEKIKKDIPAEKGKQDRDNRLRIIGFRWFALATIIVYYFYAYDNTGASGHFFLVFTLVLAYNILATLYSFKNKSKDKLHIIYLDILGIAFFTAQSGGMDSDIYLLFLFVIAYSGVYIEKTFAFKAGIFSLIAFTLTSLYSANINAGEINYWRLIIRDLYLILASSTVAMINNEVKKYGEMHKKEFKLARTDKLTGLANRHYFDQKLAEEAEYAVSSGNPLNILIFDLDNFKKFNDTYGHVWGDKLLTLFSDIIKQNIRKSDIPVRYGGEEFLLLIRDLDSVTAKSVGDRIRRQLEKQRIYIGNDEDRKRVTVSCGLSQFPKHSDSIKDVIDLADKALYHAKENGKNMVVGYDEICGSQGQII